MTGARSDEERSSPDAAATGEGEADRAARARTETSRVRVILACALGALLWASRFTLPEVSGSFDVDPSWKQAYVYFHEHGLKAGVDYVFTYGPLAFLEHGEFDAHVFWTKVLAWELVFGGAVAAVFALVSLRLRRTFDQVLYFSLLVLVSQQTGRDTYVLLALVASTILVVGRSSVSWVAIAGVSALLCAIALLKFTFLLLGLACIALIALHVARRRSALAGASVLAVFAALFAAFWLASGQALGNLAPYLRTSSWVASGYDEAMSEPAPQSRLILALVVALLIGVLLVPRIRSGPRSLALLLGASSFLAFKLGFVRQQGELTTFGFAALVPFLLEASSANVLSARSRSSLLRTALDEGARYACVLVCLASTTYLDSAERKASGFEIPGAVVERWATHVARHAGSLASLSTYAARCEVELANARSAHALPEIRRQVEGHTVDMLPPFQGALLMNELRWTPRPVFQSYAAYTPELLELNRRFLEGASAPEFLICRLRSQERRFPASEDALALEVALRDYRPLLVENDWTLLKRRGESPRAQASERVLQLDVEVGLSERVELGGLEGRCHVLALDVRASALGALRRFVYQAPPLQLELRASDHKAYQARIVPATMESGALLDPLMLEEEDVLRWYAGEPLPRVVAVRLLVPKDERDLYQPKIRVRVWRADDLLPASSD